MTSLVTTEQHVWCETQLLITVMGGYWVPYTVPRRTLQGHALIPKLSHRCEQAKRMSEN